MEQEIEALPGATVAEEVDLEAVETALRRRVLRVAARQLQEPFNGDHSDYAGAARLCACGQQARYVGRRAKRFASVLGELRLERAYYHCSACGRGHCPRSVSENCQNRLFGDEESIRYRPKMSQKLNSRTHS